MTTAVAERPRAVDRSELRVTPARVLLSEWTKFRSLRSSYITLLAAVVLTIGLGALVTAVQANHWPHASIEDKASFNPISSSLLGVNISQLAVGVLGVLLVSGEYTTGMIRSTLSAVPKRLPVLWAKLVVFAAIVAVAAVISTLVAFFVGQSLLSSQHIQASFSSPGAPRMIFGAALYLVVVGVIGMALGALLRNTAAGISTLVALFFVLPPILEAFPKNWVKHIQPYLPANAGEALWSHPDTAHLAPWNGFGVMCIWAVVAVVAGAWRLRRDDA
jgi:ABC-2 type transport system permease protein